MDIRALIREIKIVREKGISGHGPADLPLLGEALVRCQAHAEGAVDACDFEWLLEAASAGLSEHDAQGIRLALGIGGLSGNSAERREDFALHYQRSSETVRRAGGLEDQAFERLAKEVLKLFNAPPLVGSEAASGAQQQESTGVGDTRPGAAEAHSSVLRQRNAIRRPVVVGRVADVAPDYQHRRFDDEIDYIWMARTDRRIWLRGQPGVGKSYSARRIAQTAIVNAGDDQVALVIWVDSADDQNVMSALSEAVDAMPYLGLTVDDSEAKRTEKQAARMQEELAVSEWNWLIVFDNADVSSLLHSRWLPGGSNPHGRLLITTVSQDPRIPKHGNVVRATLYEPTEAEGFLRSQISGSGQPAAVATASPQDLTRLTNELGHHPLALSIAAATMTANHMSVSSWLEEFRNAVHMDDAADESDGGGYPLLVSATWRVAVQKASEGFAPGAVERAAAVAAVQDPDGHPTSLWNSHAVTQWVSPATQLERRHRVPVVVQRLIDHGVLELVTSTWNENGVATWNDGRIAIHQLAARTVREMIPSSDLSELGGILAQAWLRDVIDAPVGLKGNLSALVRSVAFDESAQLTISALLGFVGARAQHMPTVEDQDLEGVSTRSLAIEQAALEAVSGVRDHLGSSSRLLIARQSADLADLFHSSGDSTSATRYRHESARLFEQAVDDPEVGDHLRATALASLGQVLEDSGREVEANFRRRQAVATYQRLIDGAHSASELFDSLDDLVGLLRGWGSYREASETFAAHMEQVSALIDYEPTDAVDGVRHGGRLRKLAHHQLTHRVYQVAGSTYAVAASVLRRYGDYAAARATDLEALNVYRVTADWAPIEELLDRLIHLPERDEDESLADDLVRFASARMRTDHLADVSEELTRAVAIYESLHETALPWWEGADAAHLASFSQLDRLGALEMRHGNHTSAARIYDELTRRAQEHELTREAGMNHEELLARAYLLRGLANGELELYDRARSDFVSAVQILQMIVTVTSPGDFDACRTLVLALSNAMDASLKMHDWGVAITLGRERIDVLREFVRLWPDDAAAPRELLEAWILLSEALDHEGDGAAALDAYECFLADYYDVSESVNDDEVQELLRVVLIKMSKLSFRVGKLAVGTRALAQYIAILDARETYDALDRGNQLTLAWALSNRALWLTYCEFIEDARECAERALAIAHELLVRDPTDHEAEQQQILAHSSLAHVGKVINDDDLRRLHLAEMLGWHDRLSERDPAELSHQVLRATVRVEIGEMIRDAAAMPVAVEHIVAGVRVLQALLDLPSSPQEFDIPGLLRWSLVTLEDALRRSGRKDEADDTLVRIAQLDQVFPQSGSDDE